MDQKVFVRRCGRHAWSGERFSKSLGDQLIKGHWTIEALERVLTQLAESGSARKLSFDKAARDVRDQDLAAVRRGADSGGEVDGQSGDTLVGDGWLSSVNADSNAQLGAFRPRVCSQAALGFDRRGHGVLGSAKQYEERIAL